MNEAYLAVSHLVSLINREEKAWPIFHDFRLFDPLIVYESGGEVEDALFKAVCYCGLSATVLYYDAVTGVQKNCGSCKRTPCSRHAHKWGSLRYADVAYAEMFGRCRASLSARYRAYGQKGIGIDPRWNCYHCFEEDMGDQPHYTRLSRKYRKRDFSPENCFWESRF
jgi:hypothetical protein